MKAIAVIFAVLMLSACSDGPSLGKPVTPEAVGRAYVDSLVKHDASAMRAVTESGSLAEQYWEDLGKPLQLAQTRHPDQPVTYEFRQCRPLDGNDILVCSFKGSQGGTPLDLNYLVHVKNGRAVTALVGRVR